MNLGDLIPITLFVCIVWAIKIVVDARLRRQMLDSTGSQDMIRSMVESDELRRRHGSLRNGIILVALALGFAAINNFEDFTPMSLAILLGATGLGNLAYYLVARRAA